jgi:hypothetical protein
MSGRRARDVFQPGASNSDVNPPPAQRRRTDSEESTLSMYNADEPIGVDAGVRVPWYRDWSSEVRTHYHPDGGRYTSIYPEKVEWQNLGFVPSLDGDASMIRSERAVVTRRMPRDSDYPDTEEGERALAEAMRQWRRERAAVMATNEHRRKYEPLAMQRLGVRRDHRDEDAGAMFRGADRVPLGAVLEGMTGDLRDVAWARRSALMILRDRVGGVSGGAGAGAGAGAGGR